MKGRRYGGGRSFEDKFYRKTGRRLPKAIAPSKVKIDWGSFFSFRGTGFLSRFIKWVAGLVPSRRKHRSEHNIIVALSKERPSMKVLRRSDANMQSIGVRRKTF